MVDELLTPEEVKEAMGGMVVPDELYDHWWELTEKLLKAQLAKSQNIIGALESESEARHELIMRLTAKLEEVQRLRLDRPNKDEAIECPHCHKVFLVTPQNEGGG